MDWTVDRLWQAARHEPWNHRPNKSDLHSIAAALQPSDSVVGLWRLVWSLTASSVLAVTSSALVIGDGRSSKPVRQFASVFDSAPPAFRHGSRALIIPRNRIFGVELAPDRITVETDLGPLRLPAPAGANRYQAMEQALTSLQRPDALPSPLSSRKAGPGPSRKPEVVHRETEAGLSDGYPGLWADRHLVDGRMCIRRTVPRDQARRLSDWGPSAGRAWRRLPRWTRWAIAIAIVLGLQSFAAPAGVVFAGLLLIFLAVTSPAFAAKRVARARIPETALATSGSIEARVASAACWAWEETVAEPSWLSPALAQTRSSFDGGREVDAIIDLALRIHAARHELGRQPSGPAASVWQQQWEALDRAALRLGERADALIRHRDQAAELSIELAQLAEFERLERSALVVDDLTIETSAMDLQRNEISVADQIRAARETVGELIELMTRTRAPLAEPIPASPSSAGWNGSNSDR